MMAIRVLIVDDHPIVREGISRVLGTGADRMIVYEAANGLEALRMIPVCNPDVLLVDISMPGMSGMELLGRIHGEYAEIPVLMLSMHKEEQFAVRALKLGASGYLTKDCPPDQLTLAIHKVVAGGRFITQEVAEALATSIMPAQGELPHESLSNREFQVFRMLAAGQSVNEVAHALCLSANTVSTHKRRLMDKLGIDHNAGLVRYAVEHRLIE